MDISSTIQANSQQVNADDLTASPRTVEITDVEKGTAEQPVFLHLREFPGRTFRPGLSMRRVLVAIWGPEASAYIGRRLTLFNDTTVRFGNDVTGGIRISHASDIEKPVTIALTKTRGKRAPFRVEPLKDAPASKPAPTREERVQAALSAIEKAPDASTLATVWEHVEKLGLDGEKVLIDASTARTDQFNQL